MIGREMRVAFDHHRRTPTTEALQLVRRRPSLAMPRGPGVPCIVPAEILDPGALQGFSPCQGVGTPKRLSSIRKHPYRVLTQLPPQYLQGGRVERHGNRLAILRLLRAHPG